MGGHEGNVFINNQPVCDDFWDQSDALVVCRMLGFSGGIPKSGSHFGTVSTDFAMDDVFCTGSEASFWTVLTLPLIIVRQAKVLGSFASKVCI